MTTSPVRVRIAPSPTGDPHVGTAYQAVFNHVFARQHGGAFVLRIEDTDRTRSTPEAEVAIMESLRWLGLTWDEGPDVGGPCGPYRQSERLPLYREHADRLLAAGHAYRCFCTKERLEQMRAEHRGSKLFPGYDRRCRGLDPAEAERRAAAGEPHVVRMIVPTEGRCVMQDLLRGEITKDWESIDDQVILKSDGFPTYHLAVVVDDHHMGITHIIRGEEWLSSLPKHLQLYEYLGFPLPVFCHLPLLRNDDRNRTKLSKRRNPTSIGYYRSAGFLPEALVNFLGLMGWSRAAGEEKFSMAELLERFRLEEVSLGAPVFDLQKLRWLNGRYIRENLDDAELTTALQTWALDRERLQRIVPLARDRLETLADWGPLTVHFFRDAVPVTTEGLALKGHEPREVMELLQLLIWRLDELGSFDAGAVEAVFRELAEEAGLKLRDLMPPFYAAVTGARASTPLFASMAILGRDLVRARLRRAIEVLGGLSGKRLKALEKRRRP